MTFYPLPRLELQPGERLTIEVEVNDRDQPTWTVRLERGRAYVYGYITGECLEHAAVPMEGPFLDNLREQIHRLTRGTDARR